MVVYSQDDVGFSYNAATGNPVQAAGEYVLLACPSNAVPGTIVEGTAITANDISLLRKATICGQDTSGHLVFSPSDTRAAASPITASFCTTALRSISDC